MKEKDVILGICPGKANHYMAVPDGDGGRRIIKDETIRAYERSFVEQCHVYKDKMIDRPFHLVADVYYPDYRHDLDNSLKTILDCAQYARCIKDDNKCVKIDATRHYDPQRPRVEFQLIEIEPRLF